MQLWSYTAKQQEEIHRLLAEASHLAGQHAQARGLLTVAENLAAAKRRQAAAESHVTRDRPRVIATIDEALRARRVRLGDIAQRSKFSVPYTSMLLRGQRRNAGALARVHAAFQSLLKPQASSL